MAPALLERVERQAGDLLAPQAGAEHEVHDRQVPQPGGRPAVGHPQQPLGLQLGELPGRAALNTLPAGLCDTRVSTKVGGEGADRGEMFGHRRRGHALPLEHVAVLAHELRRQRPEPGVGAGERAEAPVDRQVRAARRRRALRPGDLRRPSRELADLEHLPHPGRAGAWHDELATQRRPAGAV